MNDTKVIQLAGALTCLIIIFAITGQEIDFAKEWWANVPSLIFGIFAALLK